MYDFKEEQFFLSEGEADLYDRKRYFSRHLQNSIVTENILKENFLKNLKVSENIAKFEAKESLFCSNSGRKNQNKILFFLWFDGVIISISE